MQAVAEKNAVEAISESTKSIFNTMVSLDLEVGEPFQKEERLIRTDVMVLVSFTGEYTGTISLFLPSSVALKIASNMLGMEIDRVDEDVKDAVGEVANMIAGNVKTTLSETLGEMSLTIPLVITGDSLSVTASGKDYEVIVVSSLSCKSSDSWLMTPFKIEGEEIYVGLIIKKAS